MPEICGMLYDMDGTLLDTERLHNKSWRKAFAMQGITVGEEFFNRVIGTNAEHVRRQCREMYGVDGAMMLDLEMRLTWEYMEQNGVPVLPGVREALDTLKKRGVRQCVCTSTDRSSAIKWLEKAGIYEYFDAAVCGDDITQSKPAPDIFLRGAEKLGVPIEKCAVVEDSRNGLLAGIASGATVLRVEGIVPIAPEIEAKTRFLSSFYELADLLEEYK